MARFKFGRPISLRWNGLLVEGPAETVFEIPDEYYEEFNEDIGPVEPTLVWLDSDEGATLRGRVTALEGSTGVSLSNGTPAALGTAAPGSGATASRFDHVHPTTGLSLSSHNHSGTYDPAGTAASAVASHVAAADPHPTYLTSTEGNAAYSATGHTHTSFANNLQINKADSKLQLLNTTSGSGAEDGMYLLMADTDVGYLWNAETNGALVLGTGGAERARITPAGKFGIGTNSPSHQLEVVGPASVTVGVSAGGAGFAELELVGQAGKNYITSDDTLSFDIGGTERATIATTGLNVTSGTLSQGGTAVSLSGHAHSGVYDPAGTAASAISAHEAAADPHPTYLTSTEGNAAYATTGHSHSYVTSATGTTNQVNVSSSTGAVTFSLPQSIATSSSPTFTNLTTTGYLTSANPYDSGNSTSSVAVSSVGTTPLNTTISATVSPSFVGQKFLVAYFGSSATNTSTVQYLIHSITDTGGNSLAQFRNFSNGSGVTFTNGFFGQAVWVADALGSKTFQGRVRMQSSTGVTVTIYSYGMFFIPFP